MRVRKVTYLIATIIFALITAILVGCSKRPTSGYFVANAAANQVLMIHIVEAPAERLSGAIVLTSINPAGSQLDVSNYSVAGSLTEGNVSLTITGGIATIGGWLSGGNILVGALRDNRLTLSKGGKTWRFDKVTEAAYRGRIEALVHLQEKVMQGRDASKNMKEAGAYAEQVNSSLQQYLAWGKERVDRRTNVGIWYAGRIKSYSACVARIRPLAEASVSSWRWQECVLSIENDGYDREQMLSSIQKSVALEQDHFTNINKMIEQGRVRSSAALRQLHEACPSAEDPELCESSWKQLSAEAPDYSMVSRDISAFHTLAPQLKQVLQSNLASATSGNAKLDDLAKQAQRIYQNAQD
jgi:hypothetical protein